MNKNKYISSILIEESSNLNSNLIKENIKSNDFIDNNVNLIFNNSYANTKKEKILCVGQVQSGKTKNIIYLIKKAMDLKYDYIVFFAGINNILLGQGDNRLKQELILMNNKDYKLLDANNMSLLNSYLQIDEKFIICTLKEASTFKKLYNCFSNKILEDKKILFIDDESDYGSINTGTEDFPTYFYEQIEKLYKRMEYGKLIYFTATPFANILNSCSKKEPPRIIVLEHYKDYWGIEKFNKNNNKFYLSKWKDKSDIKKDSGVVFDSIIIYLYFSAKLLISKGENNKTQLLINIVNEKEHHERILELTNNILYKLKNNNEYYLEKQIKQILESFNLMEENNFWENNKNKLLNTIQTVLKYLINKKTFYNLNSENKPNKANFLKKKNQHEIIIGGFMLSRGVTFDNLIVELIFNYPKNITIDTLLQRCRWFGNRNERQDFIKVIMTNRLTRALKLAQKYVDIFKPGEHNFFNMRNKIIELDNELEHKQENVVSTSNEKSK